MTSSGFASSLSVIIKEITKEVAIARIGIIAPPDGIFLPKKKVITKASAGNRGIKKANSSRAVFTTSGS
jgi:hypothetical protein